MARTRTPTAKLQAKGSFLRHPERKRARAQEPRPAGALGGPPERLSNIQKALWLELAAMIPTGVAHDCDRWAVELLVCQMSKFRRGRANGSEIGKLKAYSGR